MKINPRFVSVLTALVLSASVANTFTSAFAAETKDSGSIGIRIAQIPSGVATNPLASVYIVDRLQPSKVATQRIEVFNTSKVSIKVTLYPGAATYTNGEFLALAGRASNDLTKWTTITPNEILVKPGSYVGAEMTITPPADAPSIQQYGVLWAEVSGTSKSTGLTSVSRVGIRMYVPVGNSTSEEIIPTTTKSSTNEIIVSTSPFTGFTKYVIYLVYLIGLLFLVLLFVLLRRFIIARRAKRRKDKLEEKQWQLEKRRRKVAAKKLRDTAKEEDLESTDDE